MRKKFLSVFLIIMLAVSSSALLSSCRDNESVSSAQTSEVSKEEPVETEASVEEAADTEQESAEDSQENRSAESSKKAVKRKSSDKKSGSSTSNKQSSSQSGPGSSQSGSQEGSSSSGDTAEPVKECSVTLSVEGAFAGRQITVSEGASVYDVLKKSGLSIGARNSIYGVYVYSINGLSEGDKGAGSGWTYTLNGVKVMKSASKAAVSDGDTIKWAFVTG